MVANNLPQGVSQSMISLRIGHPDPTTLFTLELQAAVQSMLNSPRSVAALQYGPEQGSPNLINVLVERLNRVQGLSLRPENLMIVGGSTGAVDMIARLYAGSGAIVLIEAPTYVDAIHIFRDHGIELYSIPVDDSGLIVTELEKALHKLRANGKSPAFLYTIPTFQNPSGVTLPLDRRLEILRIAKDYGLLIVEDDVYRDLSFGAVPPANFYNLSSGENVLSIGSFSKIFAPGFRLGWLVGSAAAIQRCVNCGTTQMGGGANPFVANIVAEFCEKGYLEPHIARLCRLYQERCEVTLTALQRYMPDGVRWTVPQGGFFIWLTLPEHIFAHDVQQAALDQNVSVALGRGFFATPTEGEHNLRIAFSFAPLKDLDAGIKILGQVVEGVRA